MSAPVEEGIPANEKTYSRMASSWPRSPRIEVEIQGAPQPVRLPLDFIQASGDNAWRVVHRMVSALVNEPGQLLTVAGELLALDAQPEAGQYLFAPLNIDSDATFTWKQGPTGFRGGQAINEGESEERSSISACSNGQTRFQERLIGRDSYCLLTGEEDYTQAAHIVPKRRLDVYARVLEDVDAKPYERSMGLLLSQSLHAAYNLWHWSLYCKSGSYFVHVLVPGTKPDLMQYHGKEIPPGRFHPLVPSS